MLIKITGFDGMQPALDSRLLPDNKATLALNTKLVNGTLRPWNAPQYLMGLPKVGTIQTIYRFGQGSGDELNYWLHWLEDVDVVRGPVSDLTTERTYWTGDTGSGAYPKYGYLPDIVSGGTNYPTNWYRLGVPKPTPAPSVAAGALPPQEEIETSITSAITGITRYSATQAEVQLAEPTELNTAKATKVIVSGVTPTQYNGTFDVTWIDSDTLRYTVTSAPSGGEQAATKTLSISAMSRINANLAQVTLSAVSDFIRTKPTRISVVGCGVTQFNGTYDAVWINETAIQYVPVVNGATVSLLNSGPTPTEFTLTRISEFVCEITLTSATRFDTTKTVRVTLSNVRAPTMLNATFDANFTDSTHLRFNTTTGIPNVTIDLGDGTPPSGLYMVGWALVDLPSTPAPSGVTAVTLSGTITTELPTGGSVTGATSVYLTGWKEPEDEREREDRNYVVTFVTPLGEEGPPSDPTDIVEVIAEQDVTLSNLPLPPGGQGWNLPSSATKRIYRSATSGQSAVYLFVAELPVNQTSWTDDLGPESLGEALPSEDWIPPPSDLKGLCAMANGSLVGFKNNEVWFSEPNLPHAWPNFVSLDFNVVGLAAFGNSVLAATTGHPYIISGVDPAAMTPTKLPVEQACVSKRSVAEAAGGAVYASPDGLCYADGGGVKLLTDGLIRKEDWRSYNPSSMFVGSHEGRVFCFYTGGPVGAEQGALVFDLSGGGASFWRLGYTGVTAAYTDINKDQMYFANSSRDLYKYDAAVGTMALGWNSKTWELPHPTNFGVAQVLAENYPLTFYVYAGDNASSLSLKHSVSVTNDTPFRLPAGFRHRYWSIYVAGYASVYAVLMAHSPEELARG